MKRRVKAALGVALILGLMAFGPATALATISDSGNAAEVQYPDVSDDPSVDRSLPVTGYVAIPLLVTGAVLLAAGGVMHVRSRRR